MPPKSRYTKKEWSIQDAKNPKEQERVRLTLNPDEQNTKKKPGRPTKEKNKGT